jgi:hypothetical protein
MHVNGWSISGLAGIDHDHGPSLTHYLECSGQTGRRSANNGDIAMALDSA